MSIKIIREIVNTPLVIVSNKHQEDLILEFPRLRRTHKVYCASCHSSWSCVLYDGVSELLCTECRKTIRNIVKKRRIIMYRILESAKMKEQIHEQILDIGMHPDRVRQTQLADTLYLFRKPTN